MASRKPFYLLSRKHQAKVIRKATEDEIEKIRQLTVSAGTLSSNDNESTSSEDNYNFMLASPSSEHSLGDVTETIDAQEGPDSDVDSLESSHYSGGESSEIGSNVESVSAESAINEMLDNFDVGPFKQTLAQWVIANHVSVRGCQSLLFLLRTNPSLSALPITRQTLLQTPVGKVVVEFMDPGIYYHFNLESCLQDALFETYTPLDNVNELQVHLGIDGVSLSRSSDTDFWPIVGQVSNLEGSSVFVLGIYQGPSKPKNVNEYLQRFINDFEKLDDDGVTFEGKIFEVTLSALICDTPAKSFVCQTKGHSGKDSCFRCDIGGVRSVSGKVVCFPPESGNLRTEEDFLHQAHGDHHIGSTDLVRVPRFKIMSHIPYDYMHLILMGVMKKLLVLYFVKAAKKKLPSYVFDEVNKLIRRLKKFTPDDFPRKPRSLESLLKFKATEMRYFLLYIGVVLFNFSVRKYFPEFYRQFMLLHCATAIFCSEKVNDPRYVKYAQGLYNTFVGEYHNLHTHFKVNYNVHALLHIQQDVERYGKLDNFSAFKFENHFRVMKQDLKENGNFLQQYVKRQAERRKACPLKKKERPKTLIAAKPYFGSHLTTKLVGPCFKELIYKGARITTKVPNNCIYLDDERIMLVDEISHLRKNPEQCAVYGRVFLLKEDLYDMPIKSSKLDIFQASKLSKGRKLYSAKYISAKCVCLPLQKRGDSPCAVLPLLHLKK